MPRLLLRIATLVAVATCALLLACGGSDEETATPAPEPASPAEAAGCEQVPPPAAQPPAELPKPTERLRRDDTYVATVATSCGDFEVTLDARRAPRTGGSFKSLADEGFYEGLTFHRIVAGFVIQGGDPAGDGGGGPGYSVVEAPPAGLAYTKGVVAMAKTQAEAPGTSGSQFFVVTAEDAQLPPDYALLGEVTGGQDVVDRIGVLPTTADEQPAEPVVIRSVEVVAG